MAYVYSHYEKDSIGLEIPFYIGISNQDFIEDEPYIGNDPNEAIQHFINKPYIRMYDFGPKSHHGFKAKLSFDSAGEKSIEYQEFIKDKVYGKDYFAKVLFESDNLETINLIEYLLIKKYGFRHDGGKLFNKMDGGCKIIKGQLEYQFSFDYLLENLSDASLIWNPNIVFVNNDKDTKFGGKILCNGDVITYDKFNDIIDSYTKRINELEIELSKLNPNINLEIPDLKKLNKKPIKDKSIPA